MLPDADDPQGYGKMWQGLNNRILEIFLDSIGGPQFHVMDKIAEKLRSHFKAVNCAIFWDIDGSDTLELIGSANLHWKDTGDKVVRITKSNAKGGGLSNWLASIERPMHMDYAAIQKSGYSEGPDPDHLGGAPRYSVMSVPLKKGDSCVGLIKCENKMNDQSGVGPHLAFTPGESDVLEELAVPVALVGRVRLQATAQKLDALDLVVRTSGQKDWRQHFQLVLRETVRLLGRGAR